MAVAEVLHIGFDVKMAQVHARVDVDDAIGIDVTLMAMSSNERRIVSSRLA